MPEFTGVVTEPGLYPDVPEAVYHRDPVAHEWGSLSVSAAKLLVPPAPAAKFKWAREHGKLPTKSQKLGTLAHALTFGQPVDDVEVLDFENRTRTKAFIAAEAKVTEAGKRVVLRKEWDEAQAIAAAVWANPVAAGLLDGADYEVSGFWVDQEFGIWQRMRMDAASLAYSMPTVVDLKTSADASGEGFAKSMAEYGYVRQEVHYREGWAALLGCDPADIDFIFIVVESDPPYLTATYRPHEQDIDRASHQLRAARERFRHCSEAGIWPGYSEEIETLELPRYKRQQQERDLNEWFD